MRRLPWISCAALVATLLVHAASIRLFATSSSGRADQGDVTERRALTVVSMLAEEPNPGHRVKSRIVRASTFVGRTMDNPGTPQTTVSQETQGLAIAQPSGPHYFRLSELTEKPAVKHDALAGLVLHQPGLPPQPVILRLLISDEGTVDRVLVEDSFLGEDIERQVNEALSQVMFEPGKIGRIPVRSQMRVEARLEPIVRPLTVGAGQED